jgi:excisionase family DNA binding protein
MSVSPSSTIPVALRCPSCGYALLSADAPLGVLRGAQPEPGAAVRLLRVSEVAERLGISRGSVYTILGRGELRALHVGRRVLISMSELERFIQVGSR